MCSSYFIFCMPATTASHNTIRKLKCQIFLKNKTLNFTCYIYLNISFFFDQLYSYITLKNILS